MKKKFFDRAALEKMGIRTVADLDSHIFDDFPEADVFEYINEQGIDTVAVGIDKVISVRLCGGGVAEATIKRASKAEKAAQKRKTSFVSAAKVVCQECVFGEGETCGECPVKKTLAAIGA